MKIAIKLKESSPVDSKAVLKGLSYVTNTEDTTDGCVVCNIPQEEVTPGGRIDDIFNALGGTNGVKAITLVR